MTTGLTYTTYKTQIATMAVVEETDPAFVTILPQMITYAENRIYRDLDFLSTTTAITGYALSAGLRSLTIPEGTIVVSEQINIITPVGTSNPDASNAVRNSCLPTTKEFLDIVYGSWLLQIERCQNILRRSTIIFLFLDRSLTKTTMSK